jgi:hypothetical protein
MSSSIAPNVIDTQVNSNAPTRTHPMTTRAQNNTIWLCQFTDTIRYSIARALISMTIFALIEPTFLSNAIMVPEWRNEMQVNFNAFLKKPNLDSCSFLHFEECCRFANGYIERHKA